MIVDGRNSTKVAICFILLGVLMLAGLPFLLSHQGEDVTKFWLGVTIAVFLMLLLFGHSYEVGTRKLTAKEKQNAVKVAAGAKGGWLWGGIGILCAAVAQHVFGWELSDDLYPILVGGFSASFPLLGLAMLLDNFWLKAIFMWNNSDPKIKKLWGGK